MTVKSKNNLSSTSYQDATGTIEFQFTNDYMFRAILQKYVKVLKGLICSLLHLAPESVTEITITNPIELGKAIDDKEFILDITIKINNNTLLNLEMQVANEYNWGDRSLGYLCRSFDQLYRGQEYSEALPVIHIGFLDFQLFPDHAEFFALYKMLNIRDHHLFSDKLTLGVVDLTHIELATPEDRHFQTDHWAKLFKATTWEEIKMIAQNNEYMQEATQALYECNADELIRQQCFAREEYNRYQRTIKKALKDATEERDCALATIREQETALQEQKAALQEKDAALQEKDAALQEKDAALQERDAALQEQKTTIQEQHAEIARLRALLNEKP